MHLNFENSPPPLPHRFEYRVYFFFLTHITGENDTSIGISAEGPARSKAVFSSDGSVCANISAFASRDWWIVCVCVEVEVLRKPKENK